MATVPFATQLPEEWRKPATVTFELGTRHSGVLRYDSGTEVPFMLYQKYYAPRLCLMLGIDTLEGPLECLYDFVVYTEDQRRPEYGAPRLPVSADAFCTKANTHGFQFRPANGFH